MLLIATAQLTSIRCVRIVLARKALNNQLPEITAVSRSTAVRCPVPL